MNAKRFAILAGVAWAIGCAEVPAQTYFWDADFATPGAQGGTGNWLGTPIWFDGATNQQWLDLVTASFGGTAGTVTLNASVAVNGMAFTTSGYLINGTGTITLASPVINVANSVLDSAATISVALAGGAGLVKNGAGILILSGSALNTYTGTTLVNDGTMFLSRTAGNAITGDLVIGDNLGSGNLAAVQQFASNQIANTAKVTVNANGRWTSFSQSETIGALELNGGTVHFEPAGVLSMSSVTTIANSATAFLRGKVDLGGAIRTFNVANGAAATDLAMYPVAAGTDGLFNGGVTKVGAGTLELTGVNTFTTLQINGGAISVPEVGDAGVASAIGAGTSISFDGGTLVYTSTQVDSTNRSIVLNAGGGTIDVPSFSSALGSTGVISGSGGLTKIGAGQFNPSGVNTFTGPFTLAGGQSTVSNIADSGVNSSIGAGSTIILSGNARLFHLGANNSTNRGITLMGTGGGLASSTMLTITGPITGSGLFQKSGGGTVVLSGVNTFTGDIFIGQSTLRVANGNAIPDASGIDFNNGLAPVLDLNNSSETVGSLGNNTGGSLTGGAITLGSGTLTTGANNRSTTFNGLVSGTGNLVKIGTGAQTFTQPNSFTGFVAINGGAIRVASVTAAGVNGPLGAGNLITFDNGTLEFTGTTNGETNRAITLNAGGGRLRSASGAALLSATGIISGPGALTTQGFVELTATNNFTGPVVVDGGILSVPSVANSGVPSPLGSGSGITIIGAGLFLAGTATHATNRPVAISGGVSLSPGNGTVTFSGPISGTGGLSATGPGVLVLSGTNTFSGGVSVFNSTLRIANGNAIPDAAAVFLSDFSTPAGFDVNGSNETIGSLAGGSATSGAIALGGGTLTIGANNTSTSFDGVISGTGNIVKSGFGELTLTRASTFGGSFSILQGSLFVGDVADAGVASPLGAGLNVNFGGLGMQGTLVYTGANPDSMLRNIALTGSGGILSVTNSAASLTINGAITGAGALGIAGTIILNGLSSYSGPTFIGNGVLRQASGAHFSPNSAVSTSLLPNSALDLNGFNASIGSLSGGGQVLLGNAPLTTGGDGTSTTFSGTISGTGGQLNKVGAGTMTLSGTNTYTGVTSVNAGKLRFSGGSAIADSSPLNIAAAASAEFISGTETIASLLGSGTVALVGGNLNVGANNFGTVFDGVINGTGNLAKIGAGTLTLLNAPTYTGTTAVNAGTLALNGGFDTTGGAIAIAAGATLEARNAVSRPISGSGAITATGTLIIGDSNSAAGFAFDGTLAVGTQQVILADANLAGLGSATTMGSSGRLNSLNGIRLGPGRNITAITTISASIGGNLVNDGTINGPILAGQQLSMTGDVTGTGNFTGNTRFTDSFSPGNGPANVSLGNVLFDSTHTLTLEIGGLTAGTQHDRLTFTGTATLDGALTINLINGFQPLQGHAFTILSGGTITGAFDTLNLPALGPGLAWDFSQSGNAASLVVIPEPSISTLLLAATACAISRRTRGETRHAG